LAAKYPGSAVINDNSDKSYFAEIHLQARPDMSIGLAKASFAETNKAAAFNIAPNSHMI